MNNVLPLKAVVWNKRGKWNYTQQVNRAGIVLGEARQTMLSLMFFSIDDIVATLNLKSVDVVKIDVEGAEVEALFGSRETLKTFQPKVNIRNSK